MSRPGNTLGLLHGLHADNCDGKEYSTARPVVVPNPQTERGAEIEVVIMGWCGDCGAAEWEVV